MKQEGARVPMEMLRVHGLGSLGPPAMGDAVLEELASLGLSGEQIHVERFVSV